MRILTVLSGAGFTYETTRLMLGLYKNDSVSFVYLKTVHGGEPGSGDIPNGLAYTVPSFPTVTHPSKITSVVAVIKTTLTARKALNDNKCDVVVVIGCSHAVPMFIAAKSMGVKTIFIESITRADKLSVTGRIVRGLKLADVFVVQWPALQGKYPWSVLGTIL